MQARGPRLPASGAGARHTGEKWLFSQPNFARAIDALISVSSGRFIDRPVDLSVILTLTVPKGFIPSGLPTPEVPIESVDNLIVVESLVGKRDEHVLTVRRSFCGKHLNTSYFLKQAAGKVCVWEVTSMPDEK